MISYALLLAPVREYIETLAMDRIIKPCEFSALRTHWAVNMMRILMVFVTAVIATEAPYFADVLGTVGGITDSYLAYILPALIMIMVLRRPSRSVRDSSGSNAVNKNNNEQSRQNSNSGYVCCPTFAVGLFYFICGWGAVLAGSTIYGLLFNIYNSIAVA